MYESIEQIGDNQKAAYAKTMQRLQDENVHPAQVNQPAEKAPAGDDAPMTRTEIMALIQVLTDFVKGVATGIDGKFATIEAVNGVANKILQDINRRGYQNQQQVQDIAKDAVPPSIQGFDSDSMRKTGDTLKLLSGATSGTGDKIVAVPGTAGGGLSALGDQVLYKGVFLREYVDAVPAVVVNGVTITPAVPQTIVPPGSEINPSDYGSVADYQAALTAAKHSILATWDWMRASNDVQTP
jgi:hypothetical protein